MPIALLKSEVDALGFDLAAAVESYEAALAAHAQTVDEPAPAAHPLVEAIVRQGGFTVVDDTPVVLPPTPAELRAMHQAEIDAMEREAVGAIASPARQRLATLDLMDLRSLPLPDASQQARIAAIEGLFIAIAAVQRRAAELHVELEDVPDDQVSGWRPVWEA